MSLKLEKFLVLFITLIVCSLILGWSFFLNFGKIEVTSNQPFEIHGLDKQPIFCQSTYCLEKVPIGEFNVTFKSEQFKDINERLEIRRWQTTEAILNFEYKPVLIVSEIAESEQIRTKIPLELNDKSMPVWDRYMQSVAYFKNEDTKTELMLWNKPAQELVKITNFYNFEDAEIYWGETGEKLMVRNNTDFYLVDLIQKLKYKTDFSGDVTGLKFSPDDQKVLYIKEENVQIYDSNTKEDYFLDLPIKLSEVVWKNEEILFYFQNTEGSTEFFEYDLEAQNSVLVFTAELLSPHELKMSSDGKELEFESDNKKYELRLVE